MNASFTYHVPAVPFNGSSSTGSLGAIIHNHTNFGFNAQSNTPHMYRDAIEVTNPFERQDICIIVPKSGNEPILYNLLRTLSPVSWGIIILSLFFMSTVYRWMQSLQHALLPAPLREEYIYAWTETFSIHFQTFFGDSITRIPITQPMRGMIVCWCICTFLITNAFTAKLISSLVLPKHLDDINTLEELGNSKLNIIYPEHLNSTLFQLLNADKHMFAKLQDQMLSVSQTNFTKLLGGNFVENAYVIKDYMAEYIVSKYFDAKNGRSYYHMMQECLIYLPKVYLLERRSPYLGYVNDMLSKLHEMGYVVLWDQQTMHQYSLHGNNVNSVEETEVDANDVKIVISVEHMQTAFYLMGFGHFVSLIAFLSEWWYFKRTQRQLSRVIYFDKNRAIEYGCNVE